MKTSPALQQEAKPSFQDRIVIFDSHPIQYRSPVFGALYAKHSNLKVYYFDEQFNGNQWWFHEVGKIPVQNWNLELRKGFPSTVLGSTKWDVFTQYRNFKKILQEEKPSSVVIYGYYLKEHWVLRVLCQRLRIPLSFVGETFSNQATGFRALLKGPLRTYFFRGVSRFIAIGKKTNDFYLSQGISKNQIAVANYCTDTQFFELAPNASTSTREKIRASLGIASSDFVILFVGRLFERKRPEDVIELHRALSPNSKVHTILVGNGPMEEQIRLSSQGLKNFHIVGFKSQPQTRDFYHASDLLFVPSEYETWGLVVNEAAAAGVPSLVTETCGVAGDLVVHNETGFIYPVGNLNQAAQLVERLVSDEVLRKRLSKNVLDKVRTEYNCDQFATTLQATASKSNDG